MRRSVLLAVEGVGLLEEEEGVTVGHAAGRRGRTNVVGHEGLARSQGVVRTGLEAMLNPAKNGAETTPGGGRSGKVQGDHQIDSRGFRNSERESGSGLGVCSRDKVRSAYLLNSEQSERTHQPLGSTAWPLLLSH